MELSNEWIWWSLMNGLPAVVAGLAFLVWPTFDRMFAWHVQDRRSGITLGTGFLMRAAMFWFIIQAVQNGMDFRSIRWLMVGNTIYAVILLGATLVHGDLFRWGLSFDKLIAIIWLYLYIEEPVWMLTLVPEASAGTSPLAGDPLNGLLVVVLWLQAAVMLVYGIAIYRSGWAAKLWPWKMDTVSGIVISGFPGMWLGSSISLALAPSWPEAVDGVMVNIIWLALVVLSLIVFGKRFDLSSRVTQSFLGVNAVLLVLLVVGYFIQ